MIEIIMKDESIYHILTKNYDDYEYINNVFIVRKNGKIKNIYNLDSVKTTEIITDSQKNAKGGLNSYDEEF